MALKEYQVCTAYAVVRLDKDGKKVQRIKGGKTIKLDDSWPSTQRLIELGSLGKPGDPILNLSQARVAAKAANTGSEEGTDPADADPDVQDPGNDGGDPSKPAS